MNFNKHMIEMQELHQLNNFSIDEIRRIFLECPLNELESIILKANDIYHNFSDTNFENEIISDTVYDTLVEVLETRDAQNQLLKSIGHPIENDNVDKICLPYHMGSLNKIKASTPKILHSWKTKYNTDSIVSISDKLDGVSCMFYYTEKHGVQLFTRGNGTYGRNISHLYSNIHGFNNIDENKLKEILSNCVNDIAVRGELIMSDYNFNMFKNTASNARNIVSGIVNAKVPKQNILQNIEFIAYELLNPSELTFKEQYDLMTNIGFYVVTYEHNIPTTNITIEYLSDMLRQRKKESIYMIDGIVVNIGCCYKRIMSGNPDYAFAFKVNDIEDSHIVTVNEVEWRLSKDNLWKPRVHFDKICLKGVKISKTTGKNAKFIYDNGIGPNAKLRIIRSGDVIPEIVEVIETSVPGLPSHDSWCWDANHVEIKLNGDIKFATESAYKQFEYLIIKLKIRGINEGMIKRLWNNGIRNLSTLSNVTVDSLKTIDGIKDKSAKTISNNIQNGLTNITLIDLMVASNCFGRGFAKKKLQLIIDNYSDVVDEISNKEWYPSQQKLERIEGVGIILAKKYISGFDKFRVFVQENNIQDMCTSEIAKNVIVRGDNFKNEVVVFTGFTDATMEKNIIEQGGRVDKTLTKQTTILYVKKGKEDSSKLKRAQLNEKIRIELI